MSFIRWAAEQVKNIAGVCACIVLAIIAMSFDDLIDIWDETKEDWRAMAACTIVCFALIALAQAEMNQDQWQAAKFHFALALFTGLPFLRLTFIAWGDGARRTMEWHRP